MSEVDQFLRELEIEEITEKLLARNQRGELFNLYDELSKNGLSENEIFQACALVLQKRRRMLQSQLTGILNSIMVKRFFD